MTTRIMIQTDGPGLHEITREVQAVVRKGNCRAGLCTVMITHTSASLLIQENADPSASRDLQAWFDRLAPDGDRRYTHTSEGPDDMPSHLRSAVTRSSETIPVARGRLQLGTWQGLFLFEHRWDPHVRQLLVHLQGSR